MADMVLLLQAYNYPCKHNPRCKDELQHMETEDHEIHEGADCFGDPICICGWPAYVCKCEG